MSREKQEENDLNLKLGNDFDKILEGLVTDVTSAELFDKMEILNEEQFGKAYASMQASLAGLMKDNTVAIPQVVVYDKATGIAGSIDLLLIEPDGKVRVVDLKTSNHLQTTYDLQAAVYGKCYEECYGKKANRYGILWLKSSKRKAAQGKMQGKGWEMYESSRTQEENLDIFKTVKKLFDLENPKHKPVFTEFRTQAKRKL